ncbi:hypothetical protein NA57DRAFT_70198 [Rhizodiscina lignyota]|uniref:Uncharacterized protein n=1 Tax=Rhizodiscina lignyota TaxID=1504668 RepID=A0A9P4ILZ3_9PEZI|nr:hypothetical protein NA57DRAFT_70198 [Rhizodiscina lignyota]
MYKSIVAAFSTLLLASTAIAAPLSERQETGSGPKIVTIFFSDDACQNTVPETIYTRYIYGDAACHDDFILSQTYSSLMIIEMDPQFIGTNTALQVGNTDGDICSEDTFQHSEKFSIATNATLNQCQYIGIPNGHGPDLPGNEYRLTSLE